MTKFEKDCPHCGLPTKSKAHFTQHISQVHEGVRQQCDKCGKSFTRKSDLKSHVLVQHMGMKYQCVICFKNTTSPQSLGQHYRKEHPHFDTRKPGTLKPVFVKDLVLKSSPSKSKKKVVKSEPDYEASKEILDYLDIKPQSDASEPFTKSEAVEVTEEKANEGQNQVYQLTYPDPREGTIFMESHISDKIKQENVHFDVIKEESVPTDEKKDAIADSPLCDSQSNEDELWMNELQLSEMIADMDENTVFSEEMFKILEQGIDDDNEEKTDEELLPHACSECPGRFSEYEDLLTHVTMSHLTKDPQFYINELNKMLMQQ